uniref:7TM GPCR serpentine receptor class x (Srx) domain-containing protein n=1 Tax=Panagrolaimus sp. PS1159 TaxID=55785 RepID=A0AC35FM58_9BILA
MAQKEFRKFSSYKIQLYLGILDVACIFFNSILSGYWSKSGEIFCTHQKSSYIIGCIATALWAGTCATCMILGFNRIVEILFPKLSVKLFRGCRTYFWLIIPTVYMIYFAFFTNPLLFSSTSYAMFFDPYVNIDRFQIPIGTPKHENISHTINNILVIAVILIAYLCLCLIMLLKNHIDHDTNDMSYIQKQTFIQVTIICFLKMSAAAIYVYMQFFYTPDWLVITGQITWQTSHGVVGLVYLLLNTNMRDAVYTKIFKCWKPTTQTKPTFIRATNSKY